MYLVCCPSSRCALTLAFLATLLLGGCGKSQGPSGKVSGKLSLAGKPVERATVQFFAKDGRPVASAPVSAGQFTVAEPIPVGQYQVAVLPVQEVAAGATGSEAPPAIPAKYSDSFKSGLKADVKEGDNSLDFPLDK